MNAPRPFVIFIDYHCGIEAYIEASSFCGSVWINGSVLLNHSHMSRSTGRNDTVGDTINMATEIVREAFDEMPVCAGGIVCGSGTAFLCSPHRQLCGSLCFDRRQLGETNRANWCLNCWGLWGMHILCQLRRETTMTNLVPLY